MTTLHPHVLRAGRRTRPDTGQGVPFERVARLAAMVLRTPFASVVITPGPQASRRTRAAARTVTDQRSLVEQSLTQHVIDSQRSLIISDARLELPTRPGSPSQLAGMTAWAGFPVRDSAGYVIGALCVADRRPRRWSRQDVGALETLALIASSEVALQVALALGSERAELAQTLQESLLPPQLPQIPGLQVAARYAAGGSGAEVLGDFYDVFPSVRGCWGLVVGDVCGKGAPAAKSTAMARYTLRAEAHRRTRPSLILASLNQALLNWPTHDRRFLTAIYASVRPVLAGAVVQISSAGHPLALVRRADGRVQTFGRPGMLLGLFADPELHDARRILRAGDSLILFTDGLTEARGQITRELYGDERLAELIAGLGLVSAEQMAAAVLRAAKDFSSGELNDDTAVLVLRIP